MRLCASASLRFFSGLLPCFLNANTPSNSQIVALDGATGTLDWAVPVPAPVSSSPAIGRDGTIYVGTYYSPEADNDTILGINPDGTLKWSFSRKDTVESSPAIGPDGTVYVGGFDSKVYAIQ